MSWNKANELFPTDKNLDPSAKVIHSPLSQYFISVDKSFIDYAHAAVHYPPTSMHC